MSRSALHPPHLIVIFSLALISSHCAGDAISDLFSANGVDGTLIVAKHDGTPTYIHNKARANTRYSPASTFKIPNTLIGLDSGVVKSRASEFKWDGIKRGLAAWNSDQTLETAFRVSCLWVYQEIARQVGRERYVSDLQKLGYGNAQIGEAGDQFWLNDVLKISAIEQIDFLRKMHSESLPYTDEHLRELKVIMLADKTASYLLYAKSGWTGPLLAVGWYVGYIETKEGVWLFALNMTMDKVSRAPLRKALVIKSLKHLQLI